MQMDLPRHGRGASDGPESDVRAQGTFSPWETDTAFILKMPDEILFMVCEFVQKLPGPQSDRYRAPISNLDSTRCQCRKLKDFVNHWKNGNATLLLLRSLCENPDLGASIRDMDLTALEGYRSPGPTCSLWGMTPLSKGTTNGSMVRFMKRKFIKSDDDLIDWARYIFGDIFHGPNSYELVPLFLPFLPNLAKLRMSTESKLAHSRSTREAEDGDYQWTGHSDSINTRAPLSLPRSMKLELQASLDDNYANSYTISEDMLHNSPSLHTLRLILFQELWRRLGNPPALSHVKSLTLLSCWLDSHKIRLLVGSSTTSLTHFKPRGRKPLTTSYNAWLQETSIRAAAVVDALLPVSTTLQTMFLGEYGSYWEFGREPRLWRCGRACAGRAAQGLREPESVMIYGVEWGPVHGFDALQQLGKTMAGAPAASKQFKCLKKIQVSYAGPPSRRRRLEWWEDVMVCREEDGRNKFIDLFGSVCVDFAIKKERGCGEQLFPPPPGLDETLEQGVEEE
ncbi:hypothetical protein B0H66DRAFT_532021 [Apodospora peruviana]|uniref:Uncharacterized protein n=1 Tax=Apodospora peruviana TaxID=516989 RepID=A0AAE0ID04_9PEZI|nr:hypothetical protein B0H66DRAFT_532021 [Apodospora peruviana]